MFAQWKGCTEEFVSVFFPPDGCEAPAEVDYELLVARMLTVTVIAGLCWPFREALYEFVAPVRKWLFKEVKAGEGTIPRINQIMFFVGMALILELFHECQNK